MSFETLIYGMIDTGELDGEEGPNPHYARNRAVLNALPQQDPFPSLTRGMFTMGDPAATYRSQLIHFGGSYESLERHWPAWLAKFEALLRRTYWFGAVLHLESELFEGDYQYQWLATEEAVNRCLLGEELKPVDAWEFSGGPRRFDA